MDDYYEAIKQGEDYVRLCIWETNMTQQPGFVKWQIDRHEDGFWVHVGDWTIATFDEALRDGRAMLQSVFNNLRGL